MGSLSTIHPACSGEANSRIKENGLRQKGILRAFRSGAAKPER
jgi:hypothetical protein